MGQEESVTLNLGRVTHVPGKKLLGLFLTVENKPGALRSICDVIAKANINIIHILTSTPTHEATRATTILMFLDITNSRISVEELVDNIQKLDVVHKIRTARPIAEGLLVDEFHFPITVNGMRAVIMILPMLEGLIGIIQKHKELRALLWYQGLEIGIRVARMYKKMYRVSSLHELLRILTARAQSLGWAKVEIVKVNEFTKKIILRVYNNWECEIIKSWGIKKEPQNTFHRGIIAGIMKEFHGRDFEVIETKCIAKGDPYCEFQIKPKHLKII